MENSSSNQEPWCGPGVTALVTGAVVGAASYFSSRFFAPRITDQERKDRIKFCEAFDEYKRQIEFDTEECTLIRNLLNEHRIKLKNIDHLLTKLIIEKDNSEHTSSISVSKHKNTDSSSGSDEELENKLYSLLNSYPYIARLEDFNFENVKQCTSEREEHHTLVVSLAEIVFSKLSNIEENGIQAYEKYRCDHVTMASK